MTPAPARTKVVGPIADDGIADRIAHERDHERQTDQPRIEADDLAVEGQQKKIERRRAYSRSDRANTECQLGGPRKRRRSAFPLYWTS